MGFLKTMFSGSSVYDAMDLMCELEIFQMDSSTILMKVREKLMTKKEAKKWILGKKHLFQAREYWWLDIVINFKNAKIITQKEFKKLIK